MSLLEKLRDRGLRLSMSGGTLRVETREALTDELRALIRASKAEILQSLSGEAMCEDCAADLPGRCVRRAPPDWNSCWGAIRREGPQ